jgi:hypothetical protein
MNVWGPHAVELRFREMHRHHCRNKECDHEIDSLVISHFEAEPAPTSLLWGEGELQIGSLSPDEG